MNDALHVVPTDDLIEHTDDPDCTCGPQPELVMQDGGDVWIYTHHSLDGRELTERG